MAIGIHQRRGSSEGVRQGGRRIAAGTARRAPHPLHAKRNSLYWQNPGKSRQVGNGDRS